MRRLHSRQRSGVASQQRLRPRRFDSTVKRVPKLRFEPVSFLFLACFWIKVTTSVGHMGVFYRWRPINIMETRNFETSFNLQRVRQDSGLGFSNLSNSRFRSLIAWIQPMKLRKREFDRLEKIRQFYQPSFCPSKIQRKNEVTIVFWFSHAKKQVFLKNT